jgi:hypothetical protein
MTLGLHKNEGICNRPRRRWSPPTFLLDDSKGLQPFGDPQTDSSYLHHRWLDTAAGHLARSHRHEPVRYLCVPKPVVCSRPGLTKPMLSMWVILPCSTLKTSETYIT